MMAGGEFDEGWTREMEMKERKGEGQEDGEREGTRYLGGVAGWGGMGSG